jgi:hypothetical protein
LGGPIDLAEFEKTWELAWVRIVSTLGFCFADAELEKPDERSAAAARASNGIRMCREALEQQKNFFLLRARSRHFSVLVRCPLYRYKSSFRFLVVTDAAPQQPTLLPALDNQYRTVSWLTLTPRSCSRSSSFRSDSGNRTYNINARRIISQLVLK